MKISLLAAHSVDDDTAKAQTGRSLGEWYALLDASGGADQGRREMDGPPKGYTICATKAIKADASACFSAFASTTALERWLGSGHVLDFVACGHPTG